MPTPTLQLDDPTHSPEPTTAPPPFLPGQDPWSAPIPGAPAIVMGDYDDDDEDDDFFDNDAEGDEGDGLEEDDDFLDDEEGEDLDEGEDSDDEEEDL